MDPYSEVTFEFVPVIRQYKSGRVERLYPVNPVPPSKDITVDPATGLWARLYLPAADEDRLPIVVYLHGGGSAADAPEHAFLNRLCARARVLAVSVEYRLAPEHPVPACYDDAWSALRWAAAAEGADDDDPWIRDRGDRGRLFMAGYSTGGNVTHNVTLRAGSSEVRLRGLVLLHPFFLSAGEKAEGEIKLAWLRAKLEELWLFACGGRTAGLDDPRVNPVADGAPSLRRLGCDRILVCLAEEELRFRGKAYHDGLLASGWAEEDAQLLDSAGEDHEFFLRDPGCAKALALMDRLVAFLGGN